MHGASTALNPHKFGDSHVFVEQHSDSWAIEDNTFDSSTHIHENKNPTFQSKKKQKQNMRSTSTALTPHKPLKAHQPIFLGKKITAIPHLLVLNMISSCNLPINCIANLQKQLWLGAVRQLRGNIKNTTLQS